ncbi:Broad-complex core protein isoforms 1/2/3/4/5, partial [Frankliniella fusca]
AGQGEHCFVGRAVLASYQIIAEPRHQLTPFSKCLFFRRGFLRAARRYLFGSRVHESASALQLQDRSDSGAPAPSCGGTWRRTDRTDSDKLASERRQLNISFHPGREITRLKGRVEEEDFSERRLSFDTAMGSSQQFSLRWNNYLRHITSAFESFRSDLDLVDVTLSCEGKKIKAHKMLLSACSSYFKDLFKENPCQHPVIVFRNVKFSDLEALIDFMYQGEVNVVQDQLASFLTTAELLAVQGLTDGNGKDLADYLEEDNSEPAEENVTEIDAQSLKRPSSSTNNTFTPSNVSPASPPVKRKRWTAPAAPTSSSSQKTRNDSNETLRISKTSTSTISSGGNTVDIIPVLPAVKVEMPEFLETHTDISFNNTEPEENPLEDISTLEHKLISGAGSSKDESLDLYGGSSSDTGEISGEQMTPAELSQVLAKAGPSSEGSQDSLQGGGQQAKEGEWMRPLTSEPQHYGFTCEICGKSFKHRNSRYNHMPTHYGVTKCPVCHIVLGQRSNVKRHLKHQLNVVWKILECGLPKREREKNKMKIRGIDDMIGFRGSSCMYDVSFTLVHFTPVVDGNPLKHSRNPSSSWPREGTPLVGRVLTLDNGQFCCSVCAKQFQSLSSCYGHLHVHSGATFCNICKCVLSRKGNFKRHMRDVHGINNT